VLLRQLGGSDHVKGFADWRAQARADRRRKPLVDVQAQALVFVGKLTHAVDKALVTASVWDEARARLREDLHAELPAELSS
jgi:hypothetical protein